MNQDDVQPDPDPSAVSLSAKELDWVEQLTPNRCGYVCLRLADVRRLVAMARRVEPLEDALREVEWVLHDEQGLSVEACPWCQHDRDDGHAAECVFAALTTQEAR